MKPIKLGVVGVGRAGYGMHCEEIRNKKDKFQITACCDLIKERNEKMAEEYGCKTYDEISKLIQDPDVELVDIATRSCDHFEHAKMALLAGKDVLLEKPMCENVEEARILKELGSKPDGPRLYARHNRRFEYNFLKIQEIIKSGILGDTYEIHLTRNSYSRRDDWQTIQKYGGGQLLNWGPHIIDQSLRLLESPVKKLNSTIRQTVAAGDCEDHLTITFVGENNRLVCMQISGGMALPTPEYRVYGTRGALQIVDNVIELRYIDPAQILSPLTANPDTPGQSFGATNTFASAETLRWIHEKIDERSEDLSIFWDYLYDSYRNQKPFPITLDEAVEVIDVVTKVKAQAKDN